MEQRIYRGEVSAEGLADYLVQRFDPQPDMQAQKLGQGESWIVQVARGDKPEDRSHALSVAIARTGEGLTVTMGQQQWLTPQLAGYTAMMGLIALLVTPWVLFALIWPVTHLIGSTTLPGEVWSAVDTYMASQGAARDQDRHVTHPHGE